MLDYLEDGLTESNDKKEFEALPVGTYRAEIVEAILDLSGDVPIMTNEYVVTFGEYKGRKLWQRYYFNDIEKPEHRQYFAKALSTLGVYKLLKDASPDTHLDAAHYVHQFAMKLHGRQCEVYCSQKEYNGKIYNNTYLNRIDKQLFEKNSAGITNYAKPVDIDENEEIPF